MVVDEDKMVDLRVRSTEMMKVSVRHFQHKTKDGVYKESTNSTCNCTKRQATIVGVRDGVGQSSARSGKPQSSGFGTGWDKVPKLHAHNTTLITCMQITIMCVHFQIEHTK